MAAPPVNPFSPSVSSAVPQAPAVGAAAYPLGPVPSVVPTKPFSDYQPPAPITPYLYMYRFNPGIGVDNYNLYVRPAFQQQTFNRQVAGQIQSLQTYNWTHETAAGQPGPGQQPYGAPTTFAPGAAQPPTAATYMNLQSYYPGFGKR